MTDNSNLFDECKAKFYNNLQKLKEYKHHKIYDNITKQMNAKSKY